MAIETLADEFKQALKKVEKEKSPDPVLRYFTGDAQLKRLTDENYEGEDGAKRFWNEYLETFETQGTTFDHTNVSDKVAVLEWTSKGKLPTGKPFSYRGVSILETDGDKVKAFRTYYDSAAFVEGD